MSMHVLDDEKWGRGFAQGTRALYNLENTLKDAAGPFLD
mgnify:CR=1 FL=1